MAAEDKQALRKEIPENRASAIQRRMMKNKKNKGGLPKPSGKGY